MEFGRNGDAKEFFQTSSQKTQHPEVVSEDPRGLSGVLGFLVQLFDAGHVLGLFGGLDPVPQQHQRPALGPDRIVVGHENLPVPHDFLEFHRTGAEEGQEGFVKIGSDPQPSNTGRHPMVIETNNEPENRDHKPAKGCIAGERVFKSHQDDSELSDHGVASQEQNGQNKIDQNDAGQVIYGVDQRCLGPRARSVFLFELA